MRVEVVEFEDVKLDELYFVRIEGFRGGSGYFIVEGSEFEERFLMFEEFYRVECFILGVYFYVYFFYLFILERFEFFGVDERVLIVDGNVCWLVKFFLYIIVGNRVIVFRELFFL